MFRTLGLTAIATLVLAGAAFADPIEGNWKTQSGATAAIGKCGGNFCITLRSGEFSGKRIGRFSASGGGKYAGEITKPDTGKTYTGKASLSGKSLKMSGCVLMVLCETQTWSKL